METVFIGLGGNIDQTEETFLRVEKALGRSCQLLQTSSTIKTEPWKVETEQSFLNKILQLQVSGKNPVQLMDDLFALENKLGRDRARAPDRVIDIDMIYFDQRIRRDPQLRIPHPRAHRRPFVLKSMVELAPYFPHPVLQQTQVELLVNLRNSDYEN